MVNIASLLGSQCSGLDLGGLSHPTISVHSTADGSNAEVNFTCDYQTLPFKVSVCTDVKTEHIQNEDSGKKNVLLLTCLVWTWSF